MENNILLESLLRHRIFKLLIINRLIYINQTLRIETNAVAHHLKRRYEQNKFVRSS